MIIAGVDEVGRGPLAGPVVTAAVILNEPIEGLTDSKKLSEKRREQLFDVIMEKALAVAIARCDREEIDKLNILKATLVAMKKAVENLNIRPDKVLVDGNKAPQLTMPVETIIKGDLVEPCISAASIIAKVTRDREMIQWHQKYPEYGFASHKGYPTKQHLLALEKYGLLPIHRRSFAPVKRYLSHVSA